MSIDIKSAIRMMPSVWGSRDLVGYFAVLIVAVVLVVVGFGRLGVEYTTAQEKQKEIKDKTAFVKEWKNRDSELRSLPYRPLDKGEVEKYQEVVLKTLATNGLNLITFANVSTDIAKDNGQDFEIVFSGTWESAMRFVEGFPNNFNHGLTAVRVLKVEPNDISNGVKTTMRYKVYLK